MVRFLTAGILAALFGARFVFVLIRFSYYQETGLEHIFFLWEKGYALWGAVAGFLLAGLWLGRKEERFFSVYDRIMPGFAFTLAMIILSRAFAGQGYGEVIRTPTFQFFPASFRNSYGEWRVAVFFHEGLTGLIIWMILLRKRGNRVRIFLLLFSLSQLFFEAIRCDDYLRILFFRMSQLFSVITLFTLAWTKKEPIRVKIRQSVMLFFLSAIVFIIEYMKVKTAFPNAILHAFLLFVIVLFSATAYFCFDKQGR